VASSPHKMPFRRTTLSSRLATSPQLHRKQGRIKVGYHIIRCFTTDVTVLLTLLQLVACACWGKLSLIGSSNAVLLRACALF
jgi:hypothetical protein